MATYDEELMQDEVVSADGDSGVEVQLPVTRVHSEQKTQECAER